MTNGEKVALELYAAGKTPNEIAAHLGWPLERALRLIDLRPFPRANPLGRKQ